jgi:hypothetical protein
MRPLADIFRSYAEIVDGRHVNGTDKQSNHAYGDAYDSILAGCVKGVFEIAGADRRGYPIFTETVLRGRSSVKLMMEVGVADGSSLLAWREALPNATVVGMDIHPAARWDGEFHLGNQTNLEDCRRAAAGRQFDLIVEDATHQLEDTLTTLLYMWPFVAPGGLYIVEEFANIGALRGNVEALFGAEVVDTVGPFGGNEPLIVFRKSS